jgi:hypothetical protein
LASSKDGSFFCIASKSGFLRLYSSRELVLRGIAKHQSRIMKIKFLPGLLVCLADNGSLVVYLTEVRKHGGNNELPTNLK